MFFFPAVPLSSDSVRYSPETPEHSVHGPFLIGVCTQDYGIWSCGEYYYYYYKRVTQTGLIHFLGLSRLCIIPIT